MDGHTDQPWAHKCTDRQTNVKYDIKYAIWLLRTLLPRSIVNKKCVTPLITEGTTIHWEYSRQKTVALMCI